VPKYVRTVLLRQTSEISLTLKQSKYLRFWFKAIFYGLHKDIEKAFDHREITFIESDIGALVLKFMQHDDDIEYS